MRPLIASNPNHSLLLTTHNPNPPKFSSFHKPRPHTCSTCSRSMPFHTFTINFPSPKFKLLRKDNYKGALYTITTTRCLTEGNLGLNDENSDTQNERIDVRALASTLFDAKTSDDVDGLLKDYPDLPLPVYNSLIKGLGVSKRLEAAFAVVEWMKKNKTVNVFIYNSLLSAMKLRREYGGVGGVIEDMMSQGLEPNIVTYNTLMVMYIEQGKPEEVFELMPRIEDAGLSPTSATYSTILLAYKEIEDANGALDFFIKIRNKYRNGELQRDSCEENWDKEFVKLKNLTVKICLSLMRKWLATNEENNTRDVLEFVRSMEEAGVELDRFFFERIFWACTRKEHYAVVREFYKKLKDFDGGHELSVSIYNQIVCVMGRARKWQAALEVFEEMLERGPTPNNLSFELFVSNFTLLLTATKRRVLWKWAIRLLDKMQARGVALTSKQWNSVLNACSKAGEFDAAVEIFQEMVRRGEMPTVHTYGMLLAALQKGSLYDEAERVWDHMAKIGVKPNLHAYTILASMYAQKGDNNMVASVLQTMVQNKTDPTVVTFNAIISSCAKGRAGVAAAFEWFEKMKAMNVRPNAVSYETLIEALAEDNKPRLAYEMYVEACQAGLALTKRAYEVVYSAGQLGGQIGGLSADLDRVGALQGGFREKVYPN